MSAELTLMLWAMAVFVFSGTVKGMVGVGFPVMAMSILTLFIEPVVAVALVSIPILVTNAWQAFQANNYRAIFRRFWPLIVTMMIGTVIGGAAVTYVNANILLGAVGAVAVMFSVVSVMSPNLSIAPARERQIGVWTGMGTGIIGGLTTVHGPPVIMYLLALDLKKDAFVGAVGLVWFCASIPMVGAYLYQGVLGPFELKWSMIAVVPSLIGLYVGEKLRARINQNLFKKTLVLFLFVVGLNLVRRSIFN